jgi:histone H3/H4
MSERGIPLAAIERILRKAGADRVSDSAKAALKEVLEQAAENIGKQSYEYALHAGRKTVKASDIRLAAKQRNI